MASAEFLIPEDWLCEDESVESLQGKLSVSVTDKVGNTTVTVPGGPDQDPDKTHLGTADIFYETLAP